MFSSSWCGLLLFSFCTLTIRIYLKIGQTKKYLQRIFFNKKLNYISQKLISQIVFLINTLKQVCCIFIPANGCLTLHLLVTISFFAFFFAHEVKWDEKKKKHEKYWLPNTGWQLNAGTNTFLYVKSRLSNIWTLGLGVNNTVKPVPRPQCLH